MTMTLAEYEAYMRQLAGRAEYVTSTPDPPKEKLPKKQRLVRKQFKRTKKGK